MSRVSLNSRPCSLASTCRLPALWCGVAHTLCASISDNVVASTCRLPALWCGVAHTLCASISDTVLASTCQLPSVLALGCTHTLCFHQRQCVGQTSVGWRGVAHTLCASISDHVVATQEWDGAAFQPMSPRRPRERKNVFVSAQIKCWLLLHPTLTPSRNQYPT